MYSSEVKKHDYYKNTTKTKEKLLFLVFEYMMKYIICGLLCVSGLPIKIEYGIDLEQ